MNANWLCMLMLASGLALAQTGREQRNPFDPQRLSAGHGLTSLPRQDLGFFEPGELKLVGTIRQGNHRKALLQDPLQRVHWAAHGSLIGSGGWRITRIGEGHIVLTPSSAAGPAPGREIHLSMEQP